jgi:hypothetical protein
MCPQRDAAEATLDTLRTAGFRNSDISLVFAGGPTHASAGMLAWLAGVGALSIPGSAPLIAAGPIMGLLGGVSLNSAATGVPGALMALGVPEYEARRYEQRMRNGGVLVSIHCENEEWERRARSVLDHHDAEDILRHAGMRTARGAAAVRRKPLESF